MPLFEQLETRYLLTGGLGDNLVPLSDDDETEPLLYFSLTGRADLQGISETVRDEDVLAYNGTDFELVFDGSDVGLTSQDLNAFTMLPDGSIAMSFTSEAIIGSLGLVDDADIVRFIPTSLGDETAGTFELYFDGSDVGLTTNSEDINGLEILTDGTLLISTKDITNVPGADGVSEDVFAFFPTSLGETTAGSWALHFDGSDVGLFGRDEDIDGLALGPDEGYYFSTRDELSVVGASGDDEDVFRATPSALGEDTSSTFELFLDGSTFLLATKDIDALDIPYGPPAQPAVAVDDAYGGDEDQLLVVDAVDGLLVNDSGGGPQTAQLVGDVANGLLTLNPDGSFSYTPNDDFNGSDSFTYRAVNATSESNEATVTITVNAVNDVPVAEPLTQSTDEDTPLTVTLSGSDLDGDPLSYSILSGPVEGHLSGLAPNLTYTPEPDFNGLDSFTFQVNDGIVDSAEVTVSIAVAPLNDAPEADPLTASTKENTSRTIALTGADIEGDLLTYSIVDPPAHGTLSGSPPHLSYAPRVGYSGPDSFTFTTNDGQLDSLPATVSIIVIDNKPPVAHPQHIATDEDHSLPIVLSGADADGDPLQYSVIEGPTHGTLSGTAPNLNYLPDVNFSGADSITYTTNDGTEDSTAETIQITVRPINDPPLLTAQSAATQEETTVELLLTGGTDVDGDPLSYRVVSGPQHGNLTGTTPHLTYTPLPGYNGTDSFTFQAHDGTTESPLADFSLTINPVNDRPVAQGQTLTTSEDDDVALTLAGSDEDGDALEFSIVKSPAHGVVTGSAPQLTYTPHADFHGVDDFTFKVNDGTVDSAPASVLIFVNEVNDAPVADGQLLITREGESVDVPLTGSDVDGDPLSYAVVSGPANGSLHGVGPNLRYTPHPHYNGTDSFFFQVNDGSADSAPAKVRLLIHPVNDPPTADSQSLTTFEDESIAVTLSGSDADGHTLSFAVTSDPANGTLSGVAPDLTYTPQANFNGLDSFTFQVSDGALESGLQTVLISVNPVNDPPVADLQTAFVDEDSSVELTLAGSDVDGDSLSFTILSSPINGQLSGTAPTLTYTPYADFNGLDSFAFRVDDGAGGSDMSAMVIRVFPVDEEVPQITDLSLRVNHSDSSYHSGVANITVGFGQDVRVNDATVLKIFNHTSGTALDVSSAALHNNGSAQVTWDLSASHFPAGHYTAEIGTSGVAGVADHATLAAPYTVEFWVLPGDGNGDAVVNILDYMILQNNYNLSVGPFGPGDYDGNGTAEIADFFLLQHNYHARVGQTPADYGDAAASGGSSFPTTLAQNGARHMLGSELYLGAGIDGEADGQPSSDARGDDDASADQGVSWGTLRVDSNVDLQVTANVPGGTAVLNGWVDFNADGDWDDEGEQVFVDQLLNHGVSDLSLSIPSDAQVGPVFARFRLTSTPGYSYNGLAPDGEVEDYLLTILPALRTAPSTLATWAAAVLPDQEAAEPANAQPQKQTDRPAEDQKDPLRFDLALLEVTSSPSSRESSQTPSTLDESLVDQVFDDSDDLLPGVSL